MKTPRALATLALTAVPLVFPASASADGFDKAVRHVERQCGVRLHDVPGGWIGRLALKLVQPEGVLGLRVATHEGTRTLTLRSESAVGPTLTALLGAGWTPLVRTHSRRDGSASVHVRMHGRRCSLLFVRVDRREASVVEVSLRGDRFLRWVRDPLNGDRRAPA